VPGNRRRWWRRGILGLAAIAGLFLFWLLAVWPPPWWYRWHNPQETAFMAMRRHQDPVAALQRQYRPMPLNRIAPALKRGTMIGEDIRFYQHHGIDYVELRRALGYPRDLFRWSSGEDRGDLLHALWHSALHPGQVRGASTMTQQLAKNLYLSPSRNPLRKIKEAVTAWRLEMWLPKDRIMELYLNSVEMGPEIWGAEAASQRYFGVAARSLSDVQAATLAALLPFPRSSNPYYHPARMEWRREMILGRMR
jgi:monofunctional biosynthetic peptidoglycan transglycosylase